MKEYQRSRYEVKRLYPANGLLAVYDDDGVKVATPLAYVGLADDVTEYCYDDAVFNPHKTRRVKGQIVGIELDGEGFFHVSESSSNFCGYVRERDGTYDRLGWEQEQAA